MNKMSVSDDSKLITNDYSKYECETKVPNILKPDAVVAHWNPNSVTDGKKTDGADDVGLTGKDSDKTPPAEPATIVCKLDTQESNCGWKLKDPKSKSATKGGPHDKSNGDKKGFPTQIVKLTPFDEKTPQPFVGKVASDAIDPKLFRVPELPKTNFALLGFPKGTKSKDVRYTSKPVGVRKELVNVVAT